MRLDRLAPRTVLHIAAALVLPLVCLGCGSGATARARGRGPIVHTVLQDDDMALFNPSGLLGFISELKYLGVDELRASAEWKIEAPNPNGATPPPYFDPGNPHSYDGSPGMQDLDRAVRAASAAGIGVIIDPAFSAPRWATRNGRPAGHATDPWFNWQIDVGDLVTWEAMLARRYNGHYAPAGSSSPLPLVKTFTLWNEPNQSGFEGPQYVHGQPASPDWYRSVLRAAYPAIKRVSPSARILIGNTSSTGADSQAGNGGVPPLTFIERMACVDARLRPLEIPDCRHFTTLPADGYAQQAQLNADSEYLAWRDHVASFSQFLLRDTLIQQARDLRQRTGNPAASLSGTWTTGLELQNGSPKPALAMFRAPVVARLIRHSRVEVWGRARPMRRPGAIDVQVHADGDAPWRTILRTRSDRNGIFDAHVTVPAVSANTIRFLWRDRTGHWHNSPQTTPALLGGRSKTVASTN